MDVLRGVGGCELAGEVGEVGEGELARVGALADAEEDDVGVDEVVDCEEGRGGLDGGLGFGGAGEFAEDLAELLLDFVEGGGVGLGSSLSVSRLFEEGAEKSLEQTCASSSTEAQSMRPGKR